MLDAVGNTLAVGDRVVMTDSHYKELLHGTVVGFSPKKVRVEVTNGRAYSYGQGRTGNIVSKTSDQLCIVITREAMESHIDAAYQRGIDAERDSAATYKLGPV